MEKHTIDENTYLTATGKIDYNMTNDYMFRVILQENKTVLRGLICSLLRLKKDSVTSVEVTNPIVLGANIDEKTFILDVNVILNDNTNLNLEMQMHDLGNWTDRALNYLCRNFTQLQKGEDYTASKPVIHIGFLNYDLFAEYPEFYARYQMQNIYTHYLFSSKLLIGVVNLNQIEIATDEDKQYSLDQWVALFKSKTWEELRMIAKENPELLEAGKTLYQYNNEETIRWQCWAREDYRKQMNTIERNDREQKEKIAEQKAMLAEKDTMLREKDTMLQEKDTMLQEQSSMLAEKDIALAEMQARIKELETQLQK